MRRREFRALIGRILPSMVGFCANGSLVLIQPIGQVLRGFWFDPSAFDKTSFYVTAFFLPTYVPHDVLALTLGRPVRDSKSSDRWSFSAGNTEEELVLSMAPHAERLRSLRTAEDVVEAFKEYTTPNEQGLVNPHCYEALAYTLIQAGRYKRALEVSEKLLERADLKIPWQRGIVDRVQLIRTKLAADPGDAIQQLSDWQKETIRNLHLEKFA